MFVNKKLIADYMKLHRDGVTKLASVTKYASSSTIRKVRAGKVPKKESTRIDIANAMGVPVEELFTEKEIIEPTEENNDVTT